MVDEASAYMKDRRNCASDSRYFMDTSSPIPQQWGFVSGFWGFQYVLGRYTRDQELVCTARSQLLASHRALEIDSDPRSLRDMDDFRSLKYARFMVYDMVVHILTERNLPDIAGSVEFGYQIGLLLAGLNGQGDQDDSERIASEILCLRSLMPGIVRIAEVSEIGRGYLGCLREVSFELHMSCSRLTAATALQILQNRLLRLPP